MRASKPLRVLRFSLRSGVDTVGRCLASHAFEEALADHAEAAWMDFERTRDRLAGKEQAVEGPIEGLLLREIRKGDRTGKPKRNGYGHLRGFWFPRLSNSPYDRLMDHYKPLPCPLQTSPLLDYAPPVDL